MILKPRKVAIVGTGHVGSHCGFSLITQGVCDELLMIDIEESLAYSQALDLEDAVVYLPHEVKIKCGHTSDCGDCDVVVISAGPLPLKNQTRLDTLGSTIQVVDHVLLPILESGFSGIFVVISNPVDVVSNYIHRMSGFPKHKVIGSGTCVDSARLRRVLSSEIGVAKRSIQAYSMGEHGDSQMVPWSHVSVGHKPLLQLMKEQSEKYSQLNLDALVHQTARGGWDVFNGKGSTEFGIGTAATEIIKAIFHDEKKILPVSTLLQGEYHQQDVFASVPAVIGKDGVEEIIELTLTDEEFQKFDASCAILKEYIEKSFEYSSLNE